MNTPIVIEIVQYYGRVILPEIMWLLIYIDEIFV